MFLFSIIAWFMKDNLGKMTHFLESLTKPSYSLALNESGVSTDA